jgi:hypothetical protein
MIRCYSFILSTQMIPEGLSTQAAKALMRCLPCRKSVRDFEGYTRFYIKSPSYGPVLYDPYRNMYYRFALTPLSDEDYAQRKWWKNKSLIVLDSTFAKVGETKISDSCSFLNYFITEDGLFISQGGSFRRLPAIYKIPASEDLNRRHYASVQ